MDKHDKGYFMGQIIERGFAVLDLTTRDILSLNKVESYIKRNIPEKYINKIWKGEEHNYLGLDLKKEGGIRFINDCFNANKPEELEGIIKISVPEPMFAHNSMYKAFGYKGNKY